MRNTDAMRITRLSMVQCVAGRSKILLLIVPRISVPLTVAEMLRNMLWLDSEKYLRTATCTWHSGLL